LLGDGIFTLDGAGWTHARGLLRPQFTRDQVCPSTSHGGSKDQGRYIIY
jgi:hypothetical protein